MNNKDLFMSGVVKLFEREQESKSYSFSNEEFERLLNDIEIESATNKIQRATAGRVLKVITTSEELKEQATEIENRFSDIKFNRIINHLLEARYYGYSCFEIVYNEDYSIQSLVPVPNKNLVYKKGKWYLKVGDKEQELTREKFLLNIHRWTPANPKGQSIVKNCIKAFLDKEMFEEQLRGLAKKYGDVIIVYPFDEKMKEEDAKKIGESIKKAKGKNAIGVPVSRSHSLKDSFEFIKLSDLDPMVYQALHEKQKEKILQNILGSTLVMNSESSSGKGTQALGKVHQDGFEEVVQEVCNFCTDSLYQLLQLDAFFFGYDYKPFEWSLEKVTSEKEKREIEKEQEELRAKKVETLSKLTQTGYELEQEYLAEFLGFDPTKVLKKKDSELLEFNDTADKVEKLVNYANNYKSYLDTKVEKFTNNISSQIKKQVQNIDPTKTGVGINLDFSTFEDDFILGQLKGYVDNRAVTLGGTLEEFDPFALEFEDAIKAFSDKTPISFEALEEITDEIRAKFFWIEKATNLEVTNRLFKNLNNSLAKGGTFRQWLKDSEIALSKAGLGKQGYYLENVFRTNMMSAYSMGNYKQQMEVVETYPYWEYKAIEDDRTTNVCQSLDGTIKRYDDAFWGSYYPPNHYQCRSTVISRNARELKQKGLRVTRRKIDANVGAFKGNPAEKYWKMLEKKVTVKDIQVKENVKEFKKLNKPKPLEFPKIKEGMAETDYKEYMKVLQNTKNKDIVRVYKKHLSSLKSLRIATEREGGYFVPNTKEIVYRFSTTGQIENGRHKFHTLAHEFGHFFDDVGDIKDLHFKEIQAIHDGGVDLDFCFKKIPSQSDEFLQAIAKDKEVFKTTFASLRNEILATDATSGVQDALDGMFDYGKSGQVHWGHREGYYNQDYNFVRRFKLQKNLQTVYKKLGYDADTMTKTKELCRRYDTASEVWANITSAVTTGEQELEAVQKYLPNAYKAFIEILSKI